MAFIHNNQRPSYHQILKTTIYLLDAYPREHRQRIRTNNLIERSRKIRRRTRVAGGFPDGRSTLMLVCTRIRYVISNE